jgi:hypothetical protein
MCKLIRAKIGHPEQQRMQSSVAAISAAPMPLIILTARYEVRLRRSSGLSAVSLMSNSRSLFDFSQNEGSYK